MKKILKIFVIGSFLVYLLALVYYLFARNRGCWSDMSIIEYAWCNMNLIPFKNIGLYIQAIFDGSMNLSIPITNLFGNLILFLPMGIYMPLLFDRIDTCKKYCLGITLVIIAVEVVQLVTKRGAFDIDDLILNLSGAIIGFILWRTKLIQKISKYYKK